MWIQRTEEMIEQAKADGSYEWMKDMYDYGLAYYQEELEQAKQNLFNKTENFLINCKGEIEACKAAITIPQVYKDLMGEDWFPFTFAQESYIKKNADGSTVVYNANDKTTTIYDANGNLIGLKGKCIYTVQEAEALSRSNGNTFRIRYK